MSVLLLGGTDLTLAVAERALALDVELGGIVHVGETFSISYAPAAGVRNTRAAPIAQWCEQHDVPSYLYEGPGDLERLVGESAFGLGLAAGWYHMVPRSVRALFTHGCAGLHASLLPELRGGAPLAWAILCGLRRSGVTLFELGDGVDDGPVYGQQSFPVGDRARVADLVEAAEHATLELLDECLPALSRGELSATPQVGDASYGLQRRPEDGRIDWSRPAADIDRLIRAVGRPYPGARALFAGVELMIWDAEPFDGPAVLGVPGQIARLPKTPDPCVVTGSGTLVLRDVTDESGVQRLDDLRGASNRRFDPYV